MKSSPRSHLAADLGTGGRPRAAQDGGGTWKWVLLQRAVLRQGCGAKGMLQEDWNCQTERGSSCWPHLMAKEKDTAGEMFMC